MVLFYKRINWEDFPSINTAINALRLNAMDYANKTLDERTVELYNTKAEKSVVLNTVQDWSLDEKTGIITITKVNGEKVMFDLNIEKIPVKFELSEDGILTMTTDDGSVFAANIGKMIPVMVFESSDTVSVTRVMNRTELATNFSEYTHEFEEAFTGNIVVKVVPLEEGSMPTTQYSADLIHADGRISSQSETGITEEEFVFAVEEVIKITVSTFSSNPIVALYTETEPKEVIYRFDVKEGSIKEKHLESNYLANIKLQAENASLSATSSAESAKEAKEYAEQAKESAESISGYASEIEAIPDIYATKTEVIPVANLLATVEGKPLDAIMGKELYDMITWKYIGNVAGAAELSIPEGWKELRVLLVMSSGAGLKIPVPDIMSDMVSIGVYNWAVGGGSSNNSGTGFLRGRIHVEENKVYILNFYSGVPETPSDVVETMVLHAWYK